MLGVLLTLYLASVAAILRFGLDSLLFPHTNSFVGPQPEQIVRIPAASSGEGLVRQYGRADHGCLVFFPGQHGYSATYDPLAFSNGGLRVWLVSYPGQDDAAGNATIAEVEQFGGRAVRLAVEQCPSGKVVVLGVSLGATLAARSIGPEEVAGLVLVSAAPSLSAAIRTRLASSWYLAPLTLLPLSHILQRDYVLSDSLSSGVAVAIFQGSADQQSPIAALRGSLSADRQAAIVQVDGGTHSTTFALSRAAQLSTISRMLSHSEPNTSPERSRER
jgi:pimeloyl-ACP methyl ester carboxylesterase